MKKISNWLEDKIVYIFVFVIGMWLFYGLVMLIAFGKEDLSSAGTFGDMFGALNTLFTGLAFAGVVISLFQQNRALEQQNESLKQQQESLDKQKEELEIYKSELKDNTQHLYLQRVENTIFNLIEAHNDIISDTKRIYINNDGKTGRELFDDIFNEIEERFNSNDNLEFDASVLHYYDGVSSTKNLAFSNFSHIMRYINNLKEVSDDEKRMFVEILQQQLSIGIRLYYTAQAKINKKIAQKEYEQDGDRMNLDDGTHDLIIKYNFLI